MRSVERAVRYEIQRQAAILADGGTITQETRHWHEDTGTTSPGRPKSDADDYRYFPEPDLLPVEPEKSLIEELRAALPEPPAARRRRLKSEWGFTDLELQDVVNGGLLGEVVATVEAGATPAAAKKWWTGELTRIANAQGTDAAALAEPAQVAELAALVDEGVLTDRLARQVLEGVIAGEGSPREIVDARGLAVVSDDGALIAAIDQALASQPDVLAKIRDGKVQAAGAVIGAVMKAMQGKAERARARAGARARGRRGLGRVRTTTDAAATIAPRHPLVAVVPATPRVSQRVQGGRRYADRPYESEDIMGFLDRLFGGDDRDRQPAPQVPQAPQQPQHRLSEDELAIERYRYLLRTAPPESIEAVHAEAFAKLSPSSGSRCSVRSPSRPRGRTRLTSDDPQSLARAATRQELRQPGSMERAFAGAPAGGAGYGRRGGPSFGSMVGGSLLGTVAGVVIGSAIAQAFLPDAGTFDSAGAEGADPRATPAATRATRGGRGRRRLRR